MNQLSPLKIRQQLANLIDPDMQIPFSDDRILRDIQIKDSQVTLNLSYPHLLDVPQQSIRQSITQTLLDKWPSLIVQIQFKQFIHRHQVQKGVKPKYGIKNIIAVASGKGGVGKSCVALNLALGLKALGARVALLDADIYGPSQPRMLGQLQTQASVQNKKFEPVMSFGLQTMSIGYLLTEKTPTIWRGPMASGALLQLLNDTLWSECDYLILDLPPGTGDIQLTMAQKVPLSGSVIVTTPQDVALTDVYKATTMFKKLDIPVLGIVENMSHYTCPNCGHSDPIFGQGGADLLSSEYELPVLAKIPLSKSLREHADRGQPVVQAEALSSEGRQFIKLAQQVSYKLTEQKPEYQAPIQNLVVSD